MTRPQYPTNNLEKAKLYLHCMVEIKERLHVVTEILELPIAPLFIQELCYLQLRHICELIAIACLAAQGDYKTQKSFTQSYKPPEIFKALRAIYPDFFPEPAERITKQVGESYHHHIERSHIPDAYTESDVSKLWEMSGDHLHRASVKKYLRTTFQNRPPNLEPIRRHANGLFRLLKGHLIPIQENSEQDVRILIELGHRHEPARFLFLRLNHEDATVQTEEYTSSLQR